MKRRRFRQAWDGEKISLAAGVALKPLREALRASERDTARLDYLEKYAVIAKPGQSIRVAIDAAMCHATNAPPQRCPICGVESEGMKLHESGAHHEAAAKGAL